MGALTKDLLPMHNFILTCGLVGVLRSPFGPSPSTQAKMLWRGDAAAGSLCVRTRSRHQQVPCLTPATAEIQKNCCVLSSEHKPDDPSIFPLLPNHPHVCTYFEESKLKQFTVSYDGSPSALDFWLSSALRGFASCDSTLIPQRLWRCQTCWLWG